MKFVHTITHTFRHAFFISETCKIGSSKSIMKKGKTSFRINYILQLLLLHTYTIVQPKRKRHTNLRKKCIWVRKCSRYVSITQKILLFDVIPPFITCCCTRSYYIKQNTAYKAELLNLMMKIPTIENVPFLFFEKIHFLVFWLNHSWLKIPTHPYHVPASTHHYPLAEKGRAM